ncbi:MAG: BPTI/Kunitz domain-containing protein [Myxococcales bacterium]
MTLARGAWVAVFGLVLASACGGQSFKGNGGEAGETGSGGATSLAGASSSGGKAHAGSGSGAGSNTAGSGTAGSGAAGGPPFMSACAGPAEYNGPDGGTCDAYFPRWSHDMATGLCMPVIYGGCGGTKNNYETLEACQKACPGGSPNYDACKVARDCQLTANGCCGVCDGPGASKHDFIANNTANTARVLTCAYGDVACGACPNPETGQSTLQFFVPNCVAGECVVEDLREGDVTACKSAEDCKLRSGTACCEACGAGNVVSVRNDGSFEALVCGNVLPPCLDCAPSIPSDAIATCEPSGHCGVAYLLK